ncbi:MAG: acyltransferase [Bradyrhizobium sp.]|nr:acyltransferase [Bradyrhizobium sp.]
MTSHQQSYRPDIDGLRAVSILLVVVYHAHPWAVPGGFTGVDVFFVISGFLISRIILSERDAGGFSLLSFYARRIRRIVPALLVVLVATSVIGWVVLLPDQFILLGKNVIAGVAFSSNLFQLSQTGYFAPDAIDNPLLHLWSLGVEEQFYIFWPLTLLLIAGSRRRGLRVALFALASFGSGLAIFAGHTDWAFYAPLPRAWELLAGALLATDSLSRKQRLSATTQNLLAAFGLAAILVGAFALDRTRLFPGFYALLPVLGATAIIASPEAWVNRIVLSSRPMILVGLISYSLYLWHWPLLSYLSILRNGVPNFLEIWGAVILAVILSALTYRFVERRLRRRERVVPSLSLCMLLVGALGGVIVAASGFTFRFPAEIREIASIPPRANSGFEDRCFLVRDEAYPDNCIETGGKPLLFLWGDSTAAALYPGLKAMEESRGSFRLARFMTAGCAPIVDAGANARCDETNRAALGYLRSSRPDLVLLHAMWGSSNDLSKLRDTIALLRAIGIPRIVILGPVPVWKRTLPHTLVNTYRFRHVIPDRIASGVSGPTDDERMKRFSEAEGVEYISAWHTLCNAEGCLTRAGPSARDVLVSDIIHLTDRGSQFLIEAISKQLALP